jgi:hypothetical protein
MQQEMADALGPDPSLVDELMAERRAEARGEAGGGARRGARVTVVLDASALLVVLQGEPGADRVAQALPDAAMSLANLGEVAAKQVDIGLDVGELVDRAEATAGRAGGDRRSRLGGPRPAGRGDPAPLTDRP